MKAPDLLTALRPVVEAFGRLGVRYYIGGSVASSAHGIARATLDVDLACDLSSEQVRPLVNLLEAGYYIDDRMIREAIERRSSFNLIHLETMLKVDVFVVPDTQYLREVFLRSKQETLDERFRRDLFFIASPEDVILNKLDWFEKGQRVSERQWNDVLGVMKVQGKSLDLLYLTTWAKTMGLLELLKKSLIEAGHSDPENG
jgi:hypothetical protein